MSIENETSILSIESLVDFKSQPFKVLTDNAMYELVESIKMLVFLFR